MAKQMTVAFQFIGYMGRWIYHQKIMVLSADLRVHTAAIEAAFLEEYNLAETHYEKMRAYDHRRVAMSQAVKEYTTNRTAIQQELDTRVC